MCEQSPGQSIAPAGSLVTRPWPWMTIVALPAIACGSEPAAGSAHANSATSAMQAALVAPGPEEPREAVPQRLPFTCIGAPSVVACRA